MKLATLNDGTRDGQLAVVARDLKTAHLADGIAPTLQAALDDWAFVAPQLDALYQLLNAGRATKAFEFDTERSMAPLPRAFQRVDGGAYPNHLALLRVAAGAQMPAAWIDEPMIAQRAGDELLGPRDAIDVAHEAWGIDFGAQVAVVSGDVPMGATADQAYAQIRLLMLLNDVTLCNLVEPELERGSGLLQSKPATACSPVAVTPDELGDQWEGAKVCLPLRATLNGKLVGQPQAGSDMQFNFAQLMAHLCKSRNARAGTIVGAGTVSNQDARRGSCCLAEKRALEVRADGMASTPFLLFGDTVRIEMLDEHGKSVFGAIEQVVQQAGLRTGRPA